MALDHPGRKPSDDQLVMGNVELMPILHRIKQLLSLNESTVCTVETTDRGGRRRGAVAWGVSRHDLDHGFVVYHSIDEAEALIALLRNAIDDARRIEAGQPPLAPEGIAPPSKH